MKKVTVISFFLLLGIFIGTSFAVEVTLLGPNEYLRSKGQPDLYTDTFPGIVGEGKLIVTNGDVNGKHRISSAEIEINGIPILDQNDFNQKTDYIELPISLEEENSITIVRMELALYYTLKSLRY